ncbi:hypothetical protein NE237_032486 [Protea cynaroides]|uniref:Uncharacterized protein n=1 Tax=Protea cynaroides TaxID=273540 RepID=A0A9Q0L3G6_9MAGN|nr:hypothetical protein NE237_032486 [Protea cynaroides]
MKMVGFVMYGRPREFPSISNRLRSSLTVSDPTILLHGGTSGLLRRFHKLKHIDLVAFPRLNLEVLNLSKQRQFLRILIYSGLCFLQDSDLVAIANSFSSLEELDISHPQKDFGYLAELDYVLIISQLIEHQFPALLGQMFPLSCHFHDAGRERERERERESCRKMDLRFLGFDQSIEELLR